MIETLDPWAQQAIRVGAGLAIGALAGLERGFKLRGQREGYRVAGVRTFTLLGLAAGIAGLLAGSQPFAAAVILLAMLGYLAIAYAPRLTSKGDATSPIAASATIAAAFLALGLADDPAPKFERRWFYSQLNLQFEANADRLIELIGRARSELPAADGSTPPADL